MINENYCITIINDMQEKNEKNPAYPKCCQTPMNITLNLTINDSKIPQYCESSIALSPDKKYFAVGSTKGTIYIVNLNEGSVESTLNNKNAAINGLCWRPFNSQIYVGDSSGYLSIWGVK